MDKGVKKNTHTGNVNKKAHTQYERFIKYKSSAEGEENDLSQIILLAFCNNENVSEAKKNSSRNVHHIR